MHPFTTTTFTVRVIVIIIITATHLFFCTNKLLWLYILTIVITFQSCCKYACLWLQIGEEEKGVLFLLPFLWWWWWGLVFWCNWQFQCQLCTNSQFAFDLIQKIYTHCCGNTIPFANFEYLCKRKHLKWNTSRYSGNLSIDYFIRKYIVCTIVYEWMDSVRKLRTNLIIDIQEVILTVVQSTEITFWICQVCIYPAM